MPWYDYRCEACEHTFEARMPVERRDEAVCPACGSSRVQRAMPRVVTVLTAQAGQQGTDGACCADADGCCGGSDEACACAAGVGAEEEI